MWNLANFETWCTKFLGMNFVNNCQKNDLLNDEYTERAIAMDFYKNEIFTMVLIDNSQLLKNLVSAKFAKMR